MGDLNGRVRHIRRSVQQLSGSSVREAGDPRIYLCSGMPAAARAVDLFHHLAAAEDPGRARHVEAGVELDLVNLSLPFQKRRHRLLQQNFFRAVD